MYVLVVHEISLGTVVGIAMKYMASEILHAKNMSCNKLYSINPTEMYWYCYNNDARNSKSHFF